MLVIVAAALVDADGRVLVQQRAEGRQMAGLWEFPGGKIEPGESKQTALEREISEELGCQVEVGQEVTTTTHGYEFGKVTLTTFYCRLVEGMPTLTEHESIKWLRPDELDTIPWAPADIPTVALIQADHT